jgi:DNA-binding transcriptional MerR regulator
MPLTVSEIAQRVKPSASESERDALVERIAHWTRMQLIAPLKRLHPGTGRHRRYDDAVIGDVKVLEVMADASIPIATMREVIDVVRGDLERRMRSDQAKGKPDLLLVIETYPWGTKPYFTEHPYTIDERADRVTVFNLSRLFPAVADPPPQNGDVVRVRGE